MATDSAAAFTTTCGAVAPVGAGGEGCGRRTADGGGDGGGGVGAGGDEVGAVRTGDVGEGAGGRVDPVGCAGRFGGGAVVAAVTVGVATTVDPIAGGPLRRTTGAGATAEVSVVLLVDAAAGVEVPPAQPVAAPIRSSAAPRAAAAGRRFWWAVICPLPLC